MPGGETTGIVTVTLSEGGPIPARVTALTVTRYRVLGSKLVTCKISRLPFINTFAVSSLVNFVLHERQWMNDKEQCNIHVLPEKHSAGLKQTSVLHNLKFSFLSK
jgi:site-specific recombinase XerD